MDILSRSNQKTCTKHPAEQLQFINISESSQIKDQNVYFCEMCLSDDTNFSSTEIISIRQIIEQGDKNIIHKWPPVNNYQILKDLSNKMKENKNKQSIESKIIDYFTELKQEILKQMDLYQKKIINSVSDLSTDNELILEQYQKISKIDQLRSLLIESSRSDLSKMEDLSRLIAQLQSEKDQNTELLRDILKRYSLLEDKFNIENLNSFKKIVFSYISSFDYFSFGDTKDNNQNNNLQQENNNLSSKIMKLISNKTNYCSSSFLNKINEKLIQLGPIIEQLKVDKICEKEPISFDLLEERDFDLIHKQVDHFIRLKQNEEYKKEIQNSELIQYTLNHKLKSSRKNNFDEQFNNYLAETHPFLIDMVNLPQQEQYLIDYNFSEELKSNHLTLKSKSILINETNLRNKFGLINPTINKTVRTRFQFKILKRQDWIGIGICNAKSIKDQKFEFNCDKIGYGYYLLSNNGYSWSHSERNQHQVYQGFEFNTGDTILIEFNPEEKKLKYYNKTQITKFSLDIKIDENEDIMPCVCLSCKDEIQIDNCGIEIYSVNLD